MFEKLPEAIAHTILRNAGHDARMKCLQASKTLRRLTLEPSVWTSLHIRTPDNFSDTFVRKIQGHCSHLIIGPASCDTILGTLGTLVTKGVHHLHLYCQGEVPSTFFNTFSNFEDLTHLRVYFEGAGTRELSEGGELSRELSLPLLPNVQELHLLETQPTSLTFRFARDQMSLLTDVNINAQWTAERHAIPHFSQCTWLRRAEFSVYSQTQLRNILHRLRKPLFIDTLVLRCHCDLIITQRLPGLKNLELYVTWPGITIDIFFQHLTEWKRMQTLSVMADTTRPSGLPTLRFLGVGNMKEWLDFFRWRDLLVDNGARIVIDPLE